MLKSACCFVFIFALILAVNAHSFANPPNAGAIFDNQPLLRHCITCSQTNSTSEHCLNPSKNESSIACDRHNEYQCYIKVSHNGFITRGCVDELNEYELHQCSSRSDQSCQICNDDNCNNIVFPKERLSCHICGLLDTNCSNSSKSAPKLCQKYVHNDKCYSSNHRGYYERGCLYQATHCLQAGTCKECNTDGCNNEVLNKAVQKYPWYHFGNIIH